MPEEYKDVTFETLTELKPAIIEMGKSWAKDRPLKSLYICGPWGSGKTCFAFAAIRYLKGLKTIPNHFWPRYLTGNQLEERLSSTYLNGRWHDKELLDDFASQDLLFIDDLDKVTGTERFKNQIFHIIDTRKIHNRPTIITSNLSPIELPTILDGSVVSRMGDESRWSILKFPPGDLRKQKIKSKIIEL